MDAARICKAIRRQKAGGPKNAISFDAEKHAFSMWGVNAMEIPGMSLGAQTILMGELGSGFTEKFTSAKSFCKWCNLVPNNKISGGKLLSSKVPKQKNRVGQVFRLCANSVKSVKTGLGIYFRRQKSKGAHLQAIVATANKYEHKKNRRLCYWQHCLRLYAFCL